MHFISMLNIKLKMSISLIDKTKKLNAMKDRSERTLECIFHSLNFKIICHHKLISFPNLTLLTKFMSLKENKEYLMNTISQFMQIFFQEKMLDYLFDLLTKIKESLGEFQYPCLKISGMTIRNLKINVLRKIGQI